MFQSFQMRLILILKTVLIVIESEISLPCDLPSGLQFQEDNEVMDLFCSHNHPVIHLNKYTKTITRNKQLYRAHCSEDGEMEIIEDEFKGFVFCADGSCRAPNSTISSPKFSQYFDKTVIVGFDFSEIYYCSESKWYSLFKTELPKDMKLLNENKVNLQPSTIIYKLWDIKAKRPNSKIEKGAKNEITIKSEGNHTDILTKIISGVKLDQNKNYYYYYDIIILSVTICLFFIFIIVLFIFISKFVSANQVKQNLLRPNIVFRNSEPASFKKSLSILKGFPKINKNLSGTSCTSRNTELTSNSRHSCNI